MCASSPDQHTNPLIHTQKYTHPSKYPPKKQQQEDDRYSGVLSPLVDGLESVLKTMQTGLEAVGVSYAYGWSIVALTVLVKVLTYPFTKQQVCL